jgi:hypothetical protein
MPVVKELPRLNSKSLTMKLFKSKPDFFSQKEQEDILKAITEAEREQAAKYGYSLRADANM